MYVYMYIYIYIFALALSRTNTHTHTHTHTHSQRLWGNAMSYYHQIADLISRSLPPLPPPERDTPPAHVSSKSTAELMKVGEDNFEGKKGGKTEIDVVLEPPVTRAHLGGCLCVSVCVCGFFFPPLFCCVAAFKKSWKKCIS